MNTKKQIYMIKKDITYLQEKNFYCPKKGILILASQFKTLKYGV